MQPIDITLLPIPADCVEDVFKSVLEQNPHYFAEPMTAKECAVMLGTTAGALAQMRLRGQGPKYVNPPGLGIRYIRGEVLLWMKR